MAKRFVKEAANYFATIYENELRVLTWKTEAEIKRAAQENRDYIERVYRAYARGLMSETEALKLFMRGNV